MNYFLLQIRLKVNEATLCGLPRKRGDGAVPIRISAAKEASEDPKSTTPL